MMILIIIIIMIIFFIRICINNDIEFELLSLNLISISNTFRSTCRICYPGIWDDLQGKAIEAQIEDSKSQQIRQQHEERRKTLKVSQDEILLHLIFTMKPWHGGICSCEFLEENCLACLWYATVRRKRKYKKGSHTWKTDLRDSVMMTS